MRRLLLPLILISVVIAASVLAVRANQAANPQESTPTNTSVLSTPIINARRIPEWLRLPTSNQEFAAAVSAVVAQPGVPTKHCLKVHRDGLEIAAKNASIGYEAAELQRLVTVAAIESLPAESVFVTKVVSNTTSPIEDGVLQGDIFFVGGADPVLSTSDFLARFADDRAATSLEQLAANLSAALRQRGVTTIAGGVVGDEFRFSPTETDYLGSVWTESDNADNQVGPLSALLVNNGFIVDTPTTPLIRTEEPAAAAAALLTELLTQRGISVLTPARSGEQPPLADQEELAKIESPTITEIAKRALIDGTTAEMLFKEVGRVNGLSPASSDAFYAMQIALFQQGLPTESVQPRDGSGLSRLNRVTCSLLMALIEKEPSNEVISSALTPISASVLAPCTPPAGTNIRLHSVNRGGVTALLGEMIADNGSIVTFVLIANREPNANDFTSCNQLQTSLLDAVARYPENYGPAKELLRPLSF